MPAESPAGAGITEVGLLPVQLAAWGFTGADVEHAVDAAQAGVARGGWAFAEERTARFQDAVCPLDLDDGCALAVGQGFHWAYVVTLAAHGPAPRRGER